MSFDVAEWSTFPTVLQFPFCLVECHGNVIKRAMLTTAHGLVIPNGLGVNGMLDPEDRPVV